MNKEAEIDLIDIFNRIFFYFKKNIKILALSILIGLLITLVYSYLTPKHYQSHITVSSANNQVLHSLLESLQEESSKKNISLNLGIPNNISNKIVSILVEEEEADKADELKEPKIKPFNIYITTTDSTIFPIIEKGFIFFSENNKYLNLVDGISKNQRIKLISFINNEIIKLDSLRLNSGNTNSVYIDNKSNINEEIVELFIKKQKLEKQSELNKKITIIKSFEQFPIEKSNKIKLILITLLATILIFILIISIKKK